MANRGMKNGQNIRVAWSETLTGFSKIVQLLISLDRAMLRSASLQKPPSVIVARGTVSSTLVSRPIYKPS